jgi:hypothetical protein
MRFAPRSQALIYQIDVPHNGIPQLWRSCLADPHHSEHSRPAMYNLEVVFSLCAHFRARQDVGEWLSLVEHLVRDQGVGGSNPLSPTNSFFAFRFESDAREISNS